MTRKPDCDADLPVSDIDALERSVSRKLHEIFKAGAFDDILGQLSPVVIEAPPKTETVFHLGFALNLSIFKLERKPGTPRDPLKRRRKLGHLFVHTLRVDGEPVTSRVGISPSFMDDTKPCPACRGSGIERESALTPEQLPKRPFGTTFRDLETKKNRAPRR